MGTSRENWFCSLPDEGEHSQFFHDVVDLLLKEAVFEGTQRNNLVVRWRNPQQLRGLFNFEPSDMPATHSELLHIIHDTVVFSVKTGHPYFINQLFSRLVKYFKSFISACGCKLGENCRKEQTLPDYEW